MVSIRWSLVCCLCIGSLLVTVEANDGSVPEENAIGADDYTYSCWLNGWRKNANDERADIFGIETSHFGFTLDVADFGKAAFGKLRNPVGYEQALEHKAQRLNELPRATLLVELELILEGEK